MLAFDNAPEIDFLILADYAEAVNGKLYMGGGNWDNIVAQGFPHQMSFSIATNISVPWNYQSNRLTMKFSTVDADGAELTSFTATTPIGRPPNAIYGQRLGTIIVANVTVMFTAPGTFAQVLQVGDVERRRTFYVSHNGALP